MAQAESTGSTAGGESTLPGRWLAALRGRREQRNTSGGRSVLRALRREQRGGLRLMMNGRLAVLGLLAVWLLVSINWERALPYVAVVAVFAALGSAPYLIQQRAGNWLQWQALFLVIDICLVTYLMLIPSPLVEDPWPPQMNLRLFGFIYLLVLVVAVALSFSPGLVLFTGFACAVVWSTAFFWIASLPDSVVTSARQLIDIQQLSRTEITAAFLNPSSVNLSRWENELVVLTCITLLLAASVWRARRLVMRQVRTEVARSNLARYFSPNVVERLSQSDRRLDAASTHHVAVLFVDIVGFTGLAERRSSGSVIRLLRNFHQRIARTVFAHGGTLDKYLGDGVMATFGTPRAGPDDGVRALRAARAMIEEVEAWNRKRTARGGQPIAIGIGLHYGPAVVGDIGDQQRLEFTVIGDTVNVASRLERATRERQALIAASDAVMQAARSQDPDCDELLDGFVADEALALRGREQPVATWLYRQAAAE